VILWATMIRIRRGEWDGPSYQDEAELEDWDKALDDLDAEMARCGRRGLRMEGIEDGE
jgi:hypothetical protein